MGGRVPDTRRVGSSRILAVGREGGEAGRGGAVRGTVNACPQPRHFVVRPAHASGAEAAVRNAQAHPATPQQALNAPTADLNGDGFVTMDEVAAMRQAGLSDQQILDRMRATGQVFELSPEQQSYLRTNGVDQYVIDQIPQINRDVRNNLLGARPPAPAPVYTAGKATG